MIGCEEIKRFEDIVVLNTETIFNRFGGNIKILKFWNLLQNLSLLNKFLVSNFCVWFPIKRRIHSNDNILFPEWADQVSEEICFTNLPIFLRPSDPLAKFTWVLQVSNRGKTERVRTLQKKKN